jgi:uncharacterized protein YndB with AHSA1/START domain
MRIDAADFTVGGEDVTTCLAGGEAVAVVRGRYHDIVPDKRIVYTEIIASMDTLEGACLVTAEFLNEGVGTRLVVTLQTVALDGSTLLEEAQQGWGSALLAAGKMTGRGTALVLNHWLTRQSQIGDQHGRRPNSYNHRRRIGHRRGNRKAICSRRLQYGSQWSDPGKTGVDRQ